MSSPGYLTCSLSAYQPKEIRYFCCYSMVRLYFVHPLIGVRRLVKAYRIKPLFNFRT